MFLRLTDVCDIQYGYAFDSAQFSETEGIPLVRIRDVVRGFSETRTIETFSEEYTVYDGDILIGMDGEFNIAKWKGGNAALNQRVCKLIPKKVDTDYIFHFMPSALKAIEDKTPFVTVKHLSAKELNKIIVPIPNPDVQVRIGTVLNSIQRIVESRKCQLCALDTLIKARFVEMFGDPVENPKKWPVKPFLEIGSCKNGMNFHYNDAGVEIHCLGVGDFQDHSIISDTTVLPMVSLNEMPSDDYLLHDDDIVFVRSNGNKALVGRSIAVYPGKIPTTFSGFCIRYRKHDACIIIPYLLRVLKADTVRKKMAGRGANIQNLNQQILGTITIPVPPIELQEQFSTFVSQIDKSKSVIQEALAKDHLLLDSLMQKYFG